MNWIKSPLAWQVWSGSTLLASLSIHGVLLSLPLAAQKAPPKPETLAAVPITAIPAETTATSSPKPPEPEQTVKSPSQPDEPSFEASLFPRFPSQQFSSFPDRVESFPKQLEEPEEPVEEIETVEETEETSEESNELQPKESEEIQKPLIQESIPDDSSVKNPEKPSSPAPDKPRLNPPETPQPAENIQEKASQRITQTSQAIENDLIKALEEALKEAQEEAGSDRTEQIGSVVTNLEDIASFYVKEQSLKEYLFDAENKPKPEKLMLITDQKKYSNPQKIYENFVSPKISDQNSEVIPKPSQHEGGTIYQVKMDGKPYYSVEIIPVKDSEGKDILGNILAFWNQGSQE